MIVSWKKTQLTMLTFEFLKKVDLRCRKIREVCDEGKLKLVTSCDFEHLICRLGMKIFRIWMTRVKINHFFQVFKFLKTSSRGKVHNEDNFFGCPYKYTSRQRKIIQAPIYRLKIYLYIRWVDNNSWTKSMFKEKEQLAK